jgi:hypothetical protein
MNAAQQIMQGYANTATAQAGLAQGFAASASSVVQQDLSAVNAAALHRSPNAIVAAILYDASRDTDGGAWVDRVSETSWFNEALNGTWLYGPYSGFQSEMDARDWFGIGQSPTTGSLITGDSQTFTNGVGAWVSTATAGGSLSAINGRLRLTQSGVLGTTATASLQLATVANQRYRIDFTELANTAGQAMYVGAGTAAGNDSLASSNLGSGTYASRTLSFVATGATTWINIYNGANWAQGTYAEIDNITCTPVSFATNPSGAYYQDNTTGTFKRLWKNRTPNSALTGGAPPTGWSLNAGGSATVAGTDSAGNVQLRFTGNANDRPFIYPAQYTVAAGDVVAWSAYVDAVAVTTLLQNALNVGGTAAYTVVWYANGNIVNGGTYNVQAGDRLEMVLTITAGGTLVTRFGVGSGVPSASFDVTMSRPQFEYAARASTFEQKTVTDEGTTQVYRGNTAKFPRLTAIVAEAASVVIYDLTQPGRPMWLQVRRTTAFVAGSLGTFWPYNNGSVTPNVTGVDAGAGQVCFTTSTAGGNGNYGGLHVLDFVRDDTLRVAGYAVIDQYAGTRRGQSIALRNSDAVLPIQDTTKVIVNGLANAVAMTVLPDAPVDPCTGLQVPTIAVFTSGGISVIQNSGTVVNSSSTSAYAAGSISPDMLTAVNTSSSNIAIAAKPGQLGASFALTSIGGAAPASLGVYGQRGITAGNRSDFVTRNANEAAFYRLRLNESTPANSLVARIDAYSNTGWMVGDIRRCWLSSNVVESITATELVTNGTFNADISGWTSFDSGSGGGGAAWDGTGAMTVTGGTSGNGGGYQDVPLVVGKTYWITGTRSNSNVTLMLYPSTSMAGGTVPTISGNTYGMVFTATAMLQRVYAYAVNGATGTIDNVSVQQVEADRSYKSQPLTISGTLAKTAVASATQLVFYSGWSASNYLQQAYSADLDFGTGAWSVGAWVNIPATLTPAMFTQSGGTLLTNGDFSGGTANWSPTNSVSFSVTGGQATVQNGSTVSGSILQSVLTVGAWYVVTLDVISNSIGSGSVFLGGTRKSLVVGNAQQYIMQCTTNSNFGIDTNSTTINASVVVDNISVVALKDAVLFDRSAAAGPYYRIGMNPGGFLFSEAYDGTTTRRVTSTASYNTATSIEVRAKYATSGTLTLEVNGKDVATSATGAPLLTLNNASAVATVGNARTLDAAFPGSIALVKAGATVPTQEQSALIYEQEKFLFMPGAQCVLPDSGTLADPAYDPMQDKLKVVSAANESSWTGLVCASTSPVLSGSFSKAAHRSGVKLLARSTTNPGIDVTIPAYGLREELFNRAERASSLVRLEEVFDWVGGFTANTTGTTNPLTSVTPAVNTWAGSIIPATAGYIGAQITGTGIPAGTTIGSVESSNTVIRMSANATANGTGVAIAFTDFILPVGYEAKSVMVNGVFKQEGSTKDWTRLYDGFRETIRFAVAPGSTAWVQIKARRTK